MSNTVTERAREDLLTAIARLRTDEGWQSWLKAKSRMYLYSANNQLLIWTQCPDATIVRGMRQWRQDFNRMLVKGCRPIWILAPSKRKDKHQLDPETGKPVERIFFRGVKVFDVADTAPIPGETPVPIEPPSEPIEGNSHQKWIIPLRMYAAEHLRVTTDLETPITGGAKGFYDEDGARICVDPQLSPNGKVHVLVHELCHALGIRYSDEGGRQRAEACCEAAAFIACTAIGLDVAGESVPYIAGWADDAEEIIEADIKRIDSIAKTIANVRQ